MNFPKNLCIVVFAAMLISGNGVLALRLIIDTDTTQSKVPEFHKPEMLPLITIPNLPKPELPKVELPPLPHLPTLPKPDIPPL